SVIILSPSLEFLILSGAIIAALFILSELPLKKFIHLFFYPLFFSSVFAFSGLGGVLSPAVVILKAVNTAALLILILSTTPYYRIFSFLSLFLPPLLVDILFISYRSFFILIKQLSSLFNVLKLRGGLQRGRFFSNLKNITSALAVTLLHSFDLNQRLYQIIQLRGYRQGFVGQREKILWSRCDLVPILVVTATCLIFFLL
ncbi:MAG: energy-coupling factor transporter transmembrane component T, partial [Candidatus Contubernalis sp.]|nr:energy-coupling factor transporter transmembrane component T [Candidatus Contubernalis sp.]